MTDEDAQIERYFHDAVWRVANDFGRVEAAVAEARDIAHAVLDPQVSDEVRRWMAENWLGRFGHDPRKAKP